MVADKFYFQHRYNINQQLIDQLSNHLMNDDQKKITHTHHVATQCFQGTTPEPNEQAKNSSCLLSRTRTHTHTHSGEQRGGNGDQQGLNCLV